MSLSSNLSYYRNSMYQFQVKFGSTILDDTGMQNLTGDFRPYVAYDTYGMEQMASIAKWWNFKIADVMLSAGDNTLDLICSQQYNNNKHSIIYARNFTASVEFLSKG